MLVRVVYHGGVKMRLVVKFAVGPDLSYLGDFVNDALSVLRVGACVVVSGGPRGTSVGERVRLLLNSSFLGSEFCLDFVL
jgi:hypothetical protein